MQKGGVVMKGVQHTYGGRGRVSTYFSLEYNVPASGNCPSSNEIPLHLQLQYQNNNSWRTLMLLETLVYSRVGRIEVPERKFPPTTGPHPY